MVVGASLCNRSGCSLDVLGSVVGSLRTAAKDNVHILVATRLDDGGQTLLRNTHEGVGVGTRAHGVDSNRHL